MGVGIPTLERERAETPGFRPEKAGGSGLRSVRSESSEPRVRDFSLADFTGKIAAGFELPDLEGAIARLIDPGAATKTLHWGRNYLYLTRCETAAAPLEVVVKQFRNAGLRHPVRRRPRGSKAAKSRRGG